MANRKPGKMSDFANYAFFILLLQALVFIALGILVVMYPLIIVILVATNFIWMGVTTFLLAWRIRQLKGDIPEVLISGV